MSLAPSSISPSSNRPPLYPVDRSEPNRHANELPTVPQLPSRGDGRLPIRTGALPIANRDGTTPRVTGRVTGVFTSLGRFLGNLITSGRSG